MVSVVVLTLEVEGLARGQGTAIGDDLVGEVHIAMSLALAARMMARAVGGQQPHMTLAPSWRASCCRFVTMTRIVLLNGGGCVPPVT